jgi:hypothetical protein
MSTNNLFSTPSRLTGAARVLDLGGTLDSYNHNVTPLEADWHALLSDLLTTSTDLMEIEASANQGITDILWNTP